MSDRFQYPNTPIPYNAKPIDFAKSVADVPYMGIYTVETTQRFVPGTRYITWDGRVFKYAKSVTALYAGQGAGFTGTQTDDGITYTTCAATQNAGDMQVSVASQTFAKNELAGGYIIVYGASNADVQNRGIIGNSLASASTVIIDVDAPWVSALTASLGIEACPNPYLYLSLNASGYGSYGGVPAANVTAASKFFWLQTWGICWVAPSGTIAGGAGERQFVFNCAGGAGAIEEHNAANATTLAQQHAGFLVNRGASGDSGAPFIMLQISI